MLHAGNGGLALRLKARQHQRCAAPQLLGPDSGSVEPVYAAYHGHPALQSDIRSHPHHLRHMAVAAVEDVLHKDGETGEQLGIMSSADALHIADERGLDLVKISPQATPPVCKLMNYGKYRFEQSKREKEARKNQHVVEIKEIRMSPGIDVGDFNTKLKNAQKFLTEGNRVKVSVRFRGREMAHTEIGRELLKKFAEQCAEVATMDKAAKLEGRNMSMFLSPKTGK